MKKAKQEEYRIIERYDDPGKRSGRSILKKIFKLVLGVAIAIAVLFLALCIYAADYYRMDQTAEQLFSIATDGSELSEEELAVLEMQPNQIIAFDGEILLTGNVEGELYDPTRAMVFYPGGKVEYTAYLPLLQNFQQHGLNVILVKMPLNLAFMDLDAAEGVVERYPQYTNWILGGHSLGGVAVCEYYSKNEDDYQGALLLGSYIVGDLDDRSKVLLVYGTEDVRLRVSKILDTDQSVVIQGGNHCQFGNYGFQKGDGDGRITWKDQQNQCTRAVAEWLMTL